MDEQESAQDDLEARLESKREAARQLGSRLAALQQERELILKAIDELNSQQAIKCASCEAYHEIRELTAIQNHWYVDPWGCTGGDYWVEGELQFICPTTGVINRLLFDNTDVPWDKREEYEYNPALQFKRKYRHLFKEVKNSYGETEGAWVNNFYVDRHRERFDLVRKHALQ